MKQLEILNKIEEVLKNSLNFNSSNNKSKMESENQSNEKKISPLKEIVNLIISFFMSVIKAPFQLIQVYIKKEILAVVRKDVNHYFKLIFLLGILFTIFIVFWVLISLAVGFYFQQLGFTNLQSILLSIAFQIVIFSVVSFIFYKTTKKIKSFQMIRKYLEE
jgi:hypothetical protein